MPCPIPERGLAAYRSPPWARTVASSRRRLRAVIAGGILALAASYGIAHAATTDCPMTWSLVVPCGLLEQPSDVPNPPAGRAVAPGPVLAAPAGSAVAPAAGVPATVAPVLPVTATAPATAAPPVTATAPATATPTVTPTAAATATVDPAPLNSLATVVDDMSRLNDAVLREVNPAYGFSRGPGYVVMGNDPRISNTPSWFDRAASGLDPTAWWNSVLPWFVLFEGADNRAVNVRVHMRNYRAYWKSRRDGAWRSLGVRNAFGGDYCTQGGNYVACREGGLSPRQESEGGVSFRMAPGMNVHGWWGTGPAAIDGSDIAAFFVTAQVRLLADDPSRPDDQNVSSWLMQIGADYYPTFAPGYQGTNPGVGISRAKRIVPAWRPFNMLTFSDVGIQEPGGGVSRASVAADPPPFE